MDDHSAWAEHEIKALIAAGVNPLAAQRTVAWVLKNVPPGVDPAKWVPPANNDADIPVSDAEVQDARVAWYARKPKKIKMLLDPTVQ